MAARKATKRQAPDAPIPVYQITAPHFCGAVEIVNGKVFDTAPIVKYMMGWELKRMLNYCADKGWRCDLRVEGGRLK